MFKFIYTLSPKLSAIVRHGTHDGNYMDPKRATLNADDFELVASIVSQLPDQDERQACLAIFFAHWED